MAYRSKYKRRYTSYRSRFKNRVKRVKRALRRKIGYRM